MYALGIPKTQYRRTTQVLRSERSNPIEYNAEKQSDGFYLFTFPNMDEYDFENTVKILKNNGVTTIGADEQLTERKIMKLTDLIKEAPTLEEQRNPKWLGALKGILQIWQEKQYPDDRTKWEMYYEDIKDLVDHWEEEIEDENEERVMNTPAPSSLANLHEDKVRKAIRKLIRQ